MSIASPPEAPSASQTPFAPQAAAPPAPVYTTPSEEPGTRPRRRQPGVLAGLILIALGVVALFDAWLPGGASWLFLGLGAAFLAARVLTARDGYAVPAGILLGFGSFIWFTETGILRGPDAGGLFFVFLGLGFLATYAIVARPRAVWPLFPGMVLIGFGVFIQAAMFGAPIAQFWRLGQYWPLILVAVGVWLLLRNQIPAAARTPVAVVGSSALILVGLLVAAAAIATVSNPYAGSQMPWPMFQGLPGFGNPPLQDTVTLSAPAGSIESVRLVNTSGSTIVRAVEGSAITVQATRHYWTADQAPDVRLVPTNGGLTVETTPVGFAPGGSGTYVDYVIDAPSVLGADVALGEWLHCRIRSCWTGACRDGKWWHRRAGSARYDRRNHRFRRDPDEEYQRRCAGDVG